MDQRYIRFSYSNDKYKEFDTRTHNIFLTIDRSYCDWISIIKSLLYYSIINIVKILIIRKLCKNIVKKVFKFLIIQKLFGFVKTIDASI